MNFLYAIFLGIAVSIDAFVAGIAYGVKGITICRNSLLLVGLLTSIFSSLAMPLSYLIGNLISLQTAQYCGISLLVILGFWNIFQEYAGKKILKFSFSLGRIIINIMITPETVDIDHSFSISLTEAGLLGLALGIDNMIATFAVSLIKMLPWYTPLIMGGLQMLFIAAGAEIANKIIPAHWKIYLSFIPGLTLILLGLIRLFP